MNRFQFLRSIIIGGLGILTPGQISGTIPKTAPPVFPSGLQSPSSLRSRQHIKLLSTTVAGYQYYEGNIVEKDFTTGTMLLLQREPKNRYDSNAIAIYYGQTKIGYIPMAENSVLARIIE